MQAEMECVGELIEVYRLRTDQHLSAVYPLLDALRSSTDTLRALCAQHNLRDSYVIARVVYETAINACFIGVGGNEVSARAWRHARQKALRDLDRTIDLAGRQVIKVRWSGADVVLADEQNQSLLNEFTGRSGRELPSWTPESVRERLERIHAHAGGDATTGFAFGLLLYRHASEIAHGTLYGALFSLGAAEPTGLPKSIEALRNHRIEHCRMLLMLIGFSLASLLQVLGPLVDRSDLSKRATEAQATFSQRKRPEMEQRGDGGWHAEAASSSDADAR